MKYLYVALVFALLAFAYWWGDGKYDEGYATAKAEYQAAQIQAVAEAELERDRINKADRAIVEAQLNKAQKRSQLLSRHLRQSEDAANEYKNTLANVRLGRVRLFNAMRDQFLGYPDREPLTNAEARAITRITGGDFERWVIGVVQQYYNVADQLIALQEEVQEREN